jgi:DNA-binding Lrp family transcriptional regulator
MALDDLDKKILQQLSAGTGSYDELARSCNVSRNTVYRRISALENRGIIRNTLQCVINLERIDMTPIAVGVTISQTEEDQAVDLLSNNKNVKFLWRTFGEHNLIVIIFCSKGKEGEIIQKIKADLEKLNAQVIGVSVGFAWEKMNYSPFSDQSEIEEKIKSDRRIKVIHSPEEVSPLIGVGAR